MFKELDKYKTGNKIPINAIVHHLDGTKENKIYQVDEYRFGLGDVVNDFIRLKNRNWLWKFHNKWKYNELTRVYTKWLNFLAVLPIVGIDYE